MTKKRAKIIDSLVTEKINDIKPITSDRLSIQEAAILLRLSGAAKLMYLAHISPPKLAEASFRRWDNVIWSTFLTKLGLSHLCEVDADNNPYVPHLSITTQLALQLSKGGFGLTSIHQVSPFAYLASVAPATAHLLTLPTLENMNIEDAADGLADLPLGSHINHAIDFILAHYDNINNSDDYTLVPNDPAQFFASAS